MWVVVGCVWWLVADEYDSVRKIRVRPSCLPFSRRTLYRLDTEMASKEGQGEVTEWWWWLVVFGGGWWWLVVVVGGGWLWVAVGCGWWLVVCGGWWRMSMTQSGKSGFDPPVSRSQGGRFTAWILRWPRRRDRERLRSGGGGWWCLVAVGGGWWWWLVEVGCGWRLVVGGGWLCVVVGGG